MQSHLISDLLDFAGIRFGKMRLDEPRHRPAAGVRAAVDVVSMRGRRISASSVHVRAGYAAAAVLADEARLQQVFWNLLTNAIKFTPKGGTVDVSSGVDGSDFRVTIRDTGRGISAEFLPRLFDRFSQQDSGSAKNFSGLGIGLTIVRHLVTMHAGTITVESRGTRARRHVHGAPAACRAGR